MTPQNRIYARRALELPNHFMRGHGNIRKLMPDDPETPDWLEMVAAKFAREFPGPWYRKHHIFYLTLAAARHVLNPGETLNLFYFSDEVPRWMPTLINDPTKQAWPAMARN